MIDFTVLNSMTTEELRSLNSRVVAMIRDRQDREAWRKARSFAPGQIVQFKDKLGYVRKMRVQRVNVKTVSGFELDSGGSPMLFKQWRVSPQFLTAVE